MTQLTPEYYSDFHCIADACRHCCCIGWEIDIDPDTADWYRELPGPLGERLRGCISWEEQPHFTLTAEERCPLLEPSGLCSLILEAGEDSLCDICAEHPRFYNWYDDRVERGIGLCCEAAAALILGSREPFSLLAEGTPYCPTGKAAERDALLALARDRSVSFEERCRAILLRCGWKTPPQWNHRDWAARYALLEVLDPEWSAALAALAVWDGAGTAEYRQQASAWETEYEQLLCYFIYRHYLTMEETFGAAAAAGFAVLSCAVIFWLQAMEQAVEFSRRAELARRYSSEIEYSDENPQQLCELLAAQAAGETK